MKLYSTDLCFTLVMLAAARCLGQGTIQVTFDGPPIQPAGTSQLATNYNEGGAFFNPISSGGFFGRVGPGYPTDPQDGTAFLSAPLGSSLAFKLAGGSLFSLVSIDLAEYSTVVPNAVTVHFVGYRQDGSTVATDLTTDGIIDGTGPLADFETFTFGRRTDFF